MYNISGTSGHFSRTTDPSLLGSNIDINNETDSYIDTKFINSYQPQKSLNENKRILMRMVRM